MKYGLLPQKTMSGQSVNIPNQNNVTHYLKDNKEIKFAYLFGSYARGTAGPLSDIDLAVYLDEHLDFFTTRLLYLEEFNRLLKGQNCDLVILNNAPLVLKYEVIRGGKVLKENKRRRIPFETGVLSEYLDTEPLREVHRKKLKEYFLAEGTIG